MFSLHTSCCDYKAKALWEQLLGLGMTHGNVSCCQLSWKIWKQNWQDIFSKEISSTVLFEIPAIALAVLTGVGQFKVETTYIKIFTFGWAVSHPRFDDQIPDSHSLAACRQRFDKMSMFETSFRVDERANWCHCYCTHDWMTSVFLFNAVVVLITYARSFEKSVEQFYKKKTFTVKTRFLSQPFACAE